MVPAIRQAGMKRLVYPTLALLLLIVVLVVDVHTGGQTANNYICTVTNEYGYMLEAVLDNVSKALLRDDDSLERVARNLHSKNMVTIMYKQISILLTYQNGKFSSTHPYDVARAVKEAYEIAGSVLGLGVVAKIGNETWGVYDPRKPVAYAAYAELSFRAPLKHAIVFKYGRATPHGEAEVCLGSPALIIPVRMSWEFPEPPFADNIHVVIAVYNETGGLAYYDVLGVHVGTRFMNMTVALQLPRPEPCTSYTEEGAVYYGMRYLGDADGDGYSLLTLKIYVLVQEPDLKDGYLRVEVPGVVLLAPDEPVGC